jgi:hypothetical protein
MPHIKGMERRLIADIDAEITGESAFTTGNCHAPGRRYAHYRIVGEAIPIKEVDREPVFTDARVSYPA